MSVFRKRSNAFSLPRFGSDVVRDLVNIPTVENDVEINTEVMLNASPSEYFERHPICMEEFTLKEQIEAGVNLREVPTEGMLDSGDNLDYEVNETAEQTVLTALEKDEK